MHKSVVLQIVVGIMIIFSLLVGVIIYLARAGIITIEMALLMMVGLLGIYIGFGILILAYRLVQKLE